MNLPKISDMKLGQIFAIEGTKSYPKLKLKKGYVDMRDGIHIPNPPVDREVEVLDSNEVMQILEFKDEKALNGYRGHLIDRFESKKGSKKWKII